MLETPDILLLDEPTNHLDAQSVAWLEAFLQAYRGTVLAITHDRYFLDNVAGWILEIDRGAAYPYAGNYRWVDSSCMHRDLSLLFVNRLHEMPPAQVAACGSNASQRDSTWKRSMRSGEQKRWKRNWRGSGRVLRYFAVPQTIEDERCPSTVRARSALDRFRSTYTATLQGRQSKGKARVAAYDKMVEERDASRSGEKFLSGELRNMVSIFLTTQRLGHSMKSTTSTHCAKHIPRLVYFMQDKL